MRSSRMRHKKGQHHSDEHLLHPIGDNQYKTQLNADSNNRYHVVVGGGAGAGAGECINCNEFYEIHV